MIVSFVQMGDDKMILAITKNNEKVNPHLLKPNYIKKIEAEEKL